MSRRLAERGGVAGARGARGMTLVELMIALVLGLIVTSAALAVFSANKRIYEATESLGRVQETARTAFELMARDLREAAGNPCEAGLPVVNVVNGAETRWWTDFRGGVRGYAGSVAFPDAGFGSSAGARVSGTAALELKSAVSRGVTVVSHNAPAASFQVNTVNHGLADGDIVMVCDFDHAAIFQVTNASPGINATIVHNTGTGSPGNCTKGLGFSNPVNCSTLGVGYAYGANSIIAPLRMSRWYVGHNGRGSRSLYRAQLVNVGGTPQVRVQEIVDGVRDLQLQYLRAGEAAYADAAAIPAADWLGERVVAVRIVLTVEGPGRIGGDGSRLERRLEHTVTLRNRAA